MTGIDPSWLVGVGGMGLGAAVAAGQVVVDWTAWALVLPGRRRGDLAAAVQERLGPVGPSSGEPIEAVGADGARLKGDWRPAEGSKGAVLLLHGFAESPQGRQLRVEALNGWGWDVAALDARAHGRSGGDRGSFGGREAEDLRAWVDALTASGRLRGAEAPLCVWGRSMGAAVAVVAAADWPGLAAVVLESPYVDLRATLAAVMRRKRLPMAGWFARRALRRARALAGVPLDRPRPIDLAPAVAARALVICGTADSLVAPADARRLAEALPNAGPAVEVPGAGHSNVLEIGGPELLARVGAFLDGGAGS